MAFTLLFPRCLVKTFRNFYELDSESIARLTPIISLSSCQSLITFDYKVGSILYGRIKKDCKFRSFWNKNQLKTNGEGKSVAIQGLMND